MRTTVTLDEDVVTLLKETSRERGVSFKEALNSAIRAGLRPDRGPSAPYRTPTFDLGIRAGVDIDKALTLAGDLEDEGILRKLEMRK